MGRPKGSKNKPKSIVPTTAAAPAPVVQKKPVKAAPLPPPAPAAAAATRRGRVPGSKNKPKPGKEVVAPVTQLVVQAAPVAVVPPKVNRTEEEPETKTAAVSAAPAVYTLDDLKHPAFDAWEAALKPIVSMAAPARKLLYEEKYLPGVSLDRRVLKTMLDYLEVDVKAVIAAYAPKPK